LIKIHQGNGTSRVKAGIWQETLENYGKVKGKFSFLTFPLYYWVA